MVEGSGFENRRAREGSGGSNPFSSVKACRGCGAEVTAVEHPSDEGRTWIWRCDCGWASARTESGVVARNRALAAVARAIERLDDPPLAPRPDEGYGGDDTEET